MKKILLASAILVSISLHGYAQSMLGGQAPSNDQTTEQNIPPAVEEAIKKLPKAQQDVIATIDSEGNHFVKCVTDLEVLKFLDTATGTSLIRSDDPKTVELGKKYLLDSEKDQIQLDETYANMISRFISLTKNAKMEKFTPEIIQNVFEKEIEKIENRIALSMITTFGNDLSLSAKAVVNLHDHQTECLSYAKEKFGKSFVLKDPAPIDLSKFK